MDGPGEKQKNPQENPQAPTEEPATGHVEQKEELKPEVAAVENKVEAIEAAEQEPASPRPQLPGLEQNVSDLHIKPPQGKLKRLLKSKKFWIILVLSLLALAVAAWFIQPSRVYVVNKLGLKVPVKITTATMAEANKPSATLKNVAVTVNGADFTSNDEGVVQTQLPYGRVSVTASKSGYEPASQTEFYDFNPFFNLIGAQPKNGAERSLALELKSVGLPLTFGAKDWLTGNPITAGKFSVGDTVAEPNAQGVVSLKVPPTDATTIKIKSAFGGTYNDIEFEAKIQETPLQTFEFVPAGKDYFVSKRSGQLAIYSSNLDGTQVTEIVPPSANETAAIGFAVSPSGKFAALTSTRDGKKDSGGQLLQKLYVVNLANNQLTVLDEGRWFDFVDWSGDTLVYTTAASATSAQRLSSADLAANKKIDLGTASAYGTVRVSMGVAVYQVYHASGDSAAINNPELRTIPVKGGTEKNIGNKVDVVTQTDFDKIAYQTSDKAWHQFDVNTSQVTNIAAPTSTERAYLGSTSPDGQTRLLIDRIDGKNTLIAENVANGQEKQLYGAAGLQAPVRWIGNTIVFRIADAQQTADYGLSITGGQPKKITDVTHTTNLFDASYFGFY
ncbi:MAG TPA: hypothetical protein VFT87_03595 [Candidatus Saccharimonadales bacterium]|nr:hypothetical protein [Candidatus Saccharimonadales bacterium]